MRGHPIDALSELDQMIEKMKNLLNAHNAGMDLRNRELYSLRQIKTRVEKTESINAVDLCFNDAEYTFDTFLNGLVIALFAVFIILMARVLYNKLYKKPIISLKLNKRRRWTKEKHFRGEDHSDSHQEFNEVHIFFNITWHFDNEPRFSGARNVYL